MATIHNELPEKEKPGHFGEYLAAEWVTNQLGENFHAWFNVGWETFNEIDQVLLAPGAGTFVVEVKGGPIGHVISHNKIETQFQNGTLTKPAAQARLAAQQFGQWLLDSSAFEDRKHSPWVNHIVWFPQILRADWNIKFPEAGLVEESLSMLFQEDMKSKEAFVERLVYSVRHPLRGAPGPEKANSEEYFFGVNKALALSIGKLDLSETSKQLILKPKKESQRIAADYPYIRPWEVVFRGEPGTGKTQLLLEIGKLHAQSGARVLYVCFNKTLAADVRRQVQTLGKSSLPTWNMRVNDLWDLYSIETVLVNVGSRKGYDAQPYLDAIRKQDPSERNLFDTILIDEAQDLDDVAVKFIMSLLEPEGSFFISYGNGQELYLERKHDEMDKLIKDGDLRQLKRNFRQSANSFLVGQAFYEKSPNINSGKLWIDEKVAISDNAQKPKSVTPTPLDVFRIEPKNGDDLVSTLQYFEWTKFWASHAAALEIRRIVDRSDALGESLDLMILFPEDKSESRKRVIEFLEHQNIPFIDLVPTQNRRMLAPEGYVRLITYHSARGLTARHVIVCDFEAIDNKESWKENPKLQRTLGNVILSRASEETVILRNQDIDSPHADFIKEISKYSTELFESRTVKSILQ